MATTDAAAVAVLQERVATHGDEIGLLRERQHEHANWITGLRAEVDALSELRERVDETCKSVVALDASVRTAARLAVFVMPVASAIVAALTAFLLSRSFPPPQMVAVAATEKASSMHHKGPPEDAAADPEREMEAAAPAEEPSP